MTAKRIVLIAAFTVGLATTQVSALDWDLTVGGGISLPGEIVAKDALENADFEIDLKKPTAPLVRVAFDLYPLPGLGGGIFAFAGRAPLDEEVSLGFWDGREHTVSVSGISMIEIGGLVKGRFEIGSGRYLKTSIGLGYLHTFSDSADARMDGFVVNGDVEYEHKLRGRFSAVGQLGAAVQPYGGVKDVAYVTFGPLLYLTVGLLL